MKDLSPYNFYNTYGGNYISRFLERNTEFDTPRFIEFVIERNRGDRDSGELQDIAKHEVLRLAHEWEERKHRFPAVYGDPKERIPEKLYAERYCETCKGQLGGPPYMHAGPLCTCPPKRPSLPPPELFKVD